ncbi:hypothetical protein Acr_08g0000380 [Actinidia rufa]|uniref:Uncharacterized protein n=1 Tax=Actinidia rufa TaxID=165716 RepID=A0A7J0EYX6_9ERIC|nr:hypothetical protein Acr_08g0000380 [Actinidia rufa]
MDDQTLETLSHNCNYIVTDPSNDPSSNCKADSCGAPSLLYNSALVPKIDVKIDTNFLDSTSDQTLDTVTHVTARGRERPLPGARGARGAHGNREEGDGENHLESVIGGGANAPGGNVGGVRGTPPTAFGSAEFMQVVFTAIEGELDPLVAEVWLEQVTRALDTILVTE